MTDVFSGLALVMGMAAVLGMAAKSLKQPPLLGYVVTGLIFGLFGKGFLAGMGPIVETMGRIGVTLLLFTAGIELSVSELTKLGRTSIVAGLSEILIVGILGWCLALGLGFGLTEAIYIGIGLAFGSTIMVVKQLSENGDIQSLYGKITVGYLLVQDFVAIGLLMVLSGVAGENFGTGSLLLLAVKGAAMVILTVGLSGTVMSKIVDRVAVSTELLLITSIGWCLVVAAIVGSRWVGFTIEIGGFLAGLTLARAAEQAQIAARIRPLRDFFLVWFFVALGSSISLAGLASVWVQALIMAIFAMTVTPLVVFLILMAGGYHRRTAFLVSLTVAQISEFSLIIAAAGVRTGEIGGRVVSVLTLVALLTMTASSYIISYSGRLYSVVRRWWRDNKSGKGVIDNEETLSGHVLLFGHNRTGSRVRPVLEKLGLSVMVVDFNPEVVDELSAKGVPVVYGDMADHELYERLGLSRAALVVSTVPDINDNLLLLGGIARMEHRPGVIVTAAETADAKILYKHGADFVLVPNLVGGDYLAEMIEQHTRGREASSRTAALRKYLISKREAVVKP